MKQSYRRILLLLLTAVLILCLLPQNTVSANGYSDGYDGGQKGDGNGIFAKGIDLSDWQGKSVDFNKIKAQGFSFVILRAGFATTMDSTFENNYAKARSAGLDVGVYLYSYAENEEEAQQEAAALKGWLRGKTLEYPVYFDLEDPKTHGGLSKDALTRIGFAFLDSLAEDGWLVGLYSCKSWLDDKIDTAKIGEKYEVWMAQFLASGSSDTYEEYESVYGMWQYSASGTVDGVDGYVDLNVCFKDYPAICKRYGFNGYSATDASISLSGVSIPSVIKPGDTITLKGEIISTGGNLTNVTAGFYDKDGGQVSGRSVGPMAKQLDLGTLADGVKSKALPEGSYRFRIVATNTSGTEVLMNQSVVVAASGIRADDLALPEHLKEGDSFQLSGMLTGTKSLSSVIVSVKFGEKTVMTESVSPNTIQYNLSNLQDSFDFAELATGAYTISIDASLEGGKVQKIASAVFHVWVKNDPITISNLTLTEKNYPGEEISVSGTVTSEKSDLEVVTAKLLDYKQQVLSQTRLDKPGKTASVQEICKEMQFDLLPFGSYQLIIEGQNAGGPCVILDKLFFVCDDHIGICGLNASRYLRLGENYCLSGVVTSERSKLQFVSVSVLDVNGIEHLSAGDVPNSNAYDLSNLWNQLAFSDLEENVYTLRICARNAFQYSVLYEDELSVSDMLPSIYWKEPMEDLYHLTISSSGMPQLGGSLASSSPIRKVSLRVLGGDNMDKIVLSAIATPDSKNVDLLELSNRLRLSALTEGEYRFVVVAENETGSMEMRNQVFYVSGCPHHHLSEEQLFAPTCNDAGVIIDTSCLDCGAKVRCGEVQGRISHSYRDRICSLCGRHAPITVSVVPAEQFPESSCRIVLAARSGEHWYALNSAGIAVELPSSMASGGRQTVPADLLWEPVPLRDGSYALKSPFGAWLHFDDGRISVGAGLTNTSVKIDVLDHTISRISQGGAEQFVSFSNGTFILSENLFDIFCFMYES